MILVTGAGGQTGQAVIKALVKKGIEVCALVHRENQSEQMLGIGAKKRLNEADFLGSDVVLASLLGRRPHTLAEYLEREG